jgi:hypothetical protein
MSTDRARWEQTRAVLPDGAGRFGPPRSPAGEDHARREVDYAAAELEFARLVETEDLDGRLAARPGLAAVFERALDSALAAAYGVGETEAAAESDDAEESEAAESGGAFRPDAARLFLQRVLYRVNRLKLFWYDDLSRYENERSDYLRAARGRIEGAWQAWELSQFDAAAARAEAEDVEGALRRRAREDVAPPRTAGGLYFGEEAGEAGYRRLLAIASLDGLVEASQLSRTLGGASNEIHSMMTRLLVEEYGGGRLARKHSSFFTVMLEELGMSAEPEAYFDLVPWEVLAGINHSFLLSERKRFYLRYVGGLLYTEVSVPAAFENYRAAAERLGMSEKARGYWELHIREDERHGRWMLDDVSLPLARRYPREAWEIVLGYDQQKYMSDRAGAAVVRAARAADDEDKAEAAREAEDGGAGAAREKSAKGAGA